jgi:hypothetical protein
MISDLVIIKFCGDVGLGCVDVTYELSLVCMN